MEPQEEWISRGGNMHMISLGKHPVKRTVMDTFHYPGL